MATQRTNLRVLKRTRRNPESGDIFAFQLEPIPGKYFFGRVIATDTRLGNCEGVVLIYIYRAHSPNKTDIPVLGSTELLVPPIGTNNLPWTRGYFEVVESAKKGPEDLLSVHCFYDPTRKRYVDEYGAVLSGPHEPVGFYGLSGLGSIDNQISKALGVQPVAV